jgi:hypothetical protein
MTDIVCALLGDNPILHDVNIIRLVQDAQRMSDENACTTGQGTTEDAVLKDGLSDISVDGTESVVE